MTLWHGSNPLVLASQSRARQALLANAGLTFEAVAADIDERGLQQTSQLSAPGEIALMLGGRLFNKPKDRGQALDQLRALAGRRHELHSAIAVALDGEIIFAHVALAGMTMRPLNEAEIGAYVDEAGEVVVTSSVGAY